MIEILLATYQGERFLAAQIESILAQSYSEWTLLIHDDGSSDRTIEIANKYALAHPSKINLILDGVRTGGAKNNFSHLLSKSSSDYVMFCDQDDVWLNTKIEVFQKTMNQSEQEFGKDTPIGIFSDCRIVAHDLTTIAPSGWQYLRSGPRFASSLNLLTSRNCIFGCAMMVNKAGISVSTPIPSQALMHDWWIGLCVLKYQGHLIPIEAQTVLYRQHDLNVVGATLHHKHYRLRRLFNIKTLITEFIAIHAMARCLGLSSNWFHFLYFKILAHSRK